MGLIWQDGKWVSSGAEATPATGGMLWKDGDWVQPNGAPEPERKLTSLEDVSDLANEFMQGVTANWGDELQAAGMAAVYKLFNEDPKSIKDVYSGMKEQLQLRRDAFQKDFPKLSTGMQVTGGVLSPLAKIGVGQIAKAKTAGDAMARAGALGSAYSGAEYMGREDNPTSGGLGANMALGAVAPVALQGVGEGVKKIVGSSDKVKKLLQNTAEDAGMKPADLVDEARRMGPEASLADVTGEAGVAYGQAALGKGGAPARAVAERNLGKLDDAQQRIRDTFGRMSKSKEFSYYDTLDDLKKARKEAAGPYYEKAFDKTIQPNEDLMEVLSRPAMRKMWQQAEIDAANRGETLPRIMNWDDQGRAVFTGDRMPTLRELQSMDQELGKQLGAMSKAHASPMNTDWTLANKMQTVGSLRKDLNKALANQVPEYGQAKQLYAGGSDLLRAQNTGRSGLRGNMDDRLKAISELPAGGGKEAYTQGLMSDVYTKLGSAPDDALTGLRQLRSRNAKTVMGKVMGKDRSDAIQNRLTTEQRYREVGNKLLGGSQTELRAGAKEMLEEGLSSPIMRGQLIEQIQEVVKNRFTKKLSAKAATEFVDVLTKPGGVEDAIKILERQGIPNDQAVATVNNLVNQLQKAAVTAPGTLMSGEAL